MWWVYVIQSQQPRFTKRGKHVPGVCYVGSTTDPPRRLQQHNGSRSGGGHYTAKHRPWRVRAIFGPYADRSEAFRAEMALKRSKRGESRSQWSAEDHPLCRGEGAKHPWVIDGTWRPTPP
jgi:predicted GIY-YIG superfamily endonuclease